MNTNNRMASVELLRVVCIVLIIVHHITYWQQPAHIECNSNSIVQAYTFTINRFFNFHVDVFILISGYFGIRHANQKLISILILLWFYSVVLSFYAFFLNGTIDWWFLINPVQESPWWFMCNYVYLLLLAPFLNMITDKARSYREWGHLLCVCLIFNVFFCWIVNDPKLNYYGHNLITFVTMYIIGRWLYTPFALPFISFIKRIGGGNLCGAFIVTCICVALISMINHFLHLVLTLPDYNSPTTIFAAIVFFLAFRTWNLKPYKVITFLSESAVAVYLMHSNHIMEPLLSKLFWKGLASQTNILSEILYLPLFVVILYVSICCFDKFRIILTTPILKHLGKWQPLR